MTEIIPFRGIYYNREKASGGEVVAPPYDVISPEMRDELYARSPYNAVRVDFGKDLPGDSDSENRYTRASAYLEEWLSNGILLRSKRPCYFIYRMDFKVRGGNRSLTGFFGLVRLVELGEGVYPHEATHSKPKLDRLSLMEVTGANTSPIFSLYRAPDSEVREVLADASSGEPYLTASDTDGTVHSFWILEEEFAVKTIREALGSVRVFIADGHHRYETALSYRKLMREKTKGPSREEPFDFVLMFLAELDDPGLTVLPTHRVVTVDVDDICDRLSGYFDVYKLPPGSDIIESIDGRSHAFGLYAGGDGYVLDYRGGDLEESVDSSLRELDVVVLHKMIFGKLLEVGNWAYEMDYASTLARVDDGEFDAAFFLNPTAVSDVERVAFSGMRMPPKSTYFYPKVRTGFVMNSLKSF